MRAIPFGAIGALRALVTLRALAAFFARRSSSLFLDVRSFGFRGCLFRLRGEIFPEGRWFFGYALVLRSLRRCLLFLLIFAIAATTTPSAASAPPTRCGLAAFQGLCGLAVLGGLGKSVCDFEFGLFVCVDRIAGEVTAELDRLSLGLG
jgi:hypothetical protein